MSDEEKKEFEQKIKKFYLTGFAIFLLTFAIILFSSFSKYSPPYYITMPYSTIMVYGGLAIILVGIILVLRKVSWCYPSFLMKVPEFSHEIKMKSCLTGITLMLIGVALLETVSIANGRGMMNANPLGPTICMFQMGFLIMTNMRLKKKLLVLVLNNMEDCRGVATQNPGEGTPGYK